MAAVRQLTPVERLRAMICEIYADHFDEMASMLEDVQKQKTFQNQNTIDSINLLADIRDHLINFNLEFPLTLAAQEIDALQTKNIPGIKKKIAEFSQVADALENIVIPELLSQAQKHRIGMYVDEIIQSKEYFWAHILLGENVKETFSSLLLPPITAIVQREMKNKN